VTLGGGGAGVVGGGGLRSEKCYVCLEQTPPDTGR